MIYAAAKMGNSLGSATFGRTRPLELSCPQVIDISCEFERRHLLDLQAVGLSKFTQSPRAWPCSDRRTFRNYDDSLI
jgi:hypothetical protein